MDRPVRAAVCAVFPVVYAWRLATRARVADEPLLEEQAAVDSASAHDHDLVPSAAEQENVAIPTAEVDLTASMDCSVQQAC